MLEILNAGELGTITRWRRGSASRSCRRTTSGGSTTSLAGGALKDAGCYTIHLCASPGVASDPVRGRVGTPMQRTGSACQSQPSSMRTSWASAGRWRRAQASLVPPRRYSISSSVSPPMPANISATATSVSPAPAAPRPGQWSWRIPQAEAGLGDDLDRLAPMPTVVESVMLQATAAAVVKVRGGDRIEYARYAAGFELAKPNGGPKDNSTDSRSDRVSPQVATLHRAR